MLNVTLVKKASGDNYSIEAGVHDGVNNFDHHGEYSNNPCPCINKSIKPIADWEINPIIEITHMDGDTFIGILRLLGKELPDIDLNLAAEIDTRGSLGVLRDSRTLAWMVGIEKVAEYCEFQRLAAGDERIPVTEEVEDMIQWSTERVIEVGFEEMKNAAAVYHGNQVRGSEDFKVGLWVVASDSHVDTSLPYENGYEIVIIFKAHKNSISIYCHPDSHYTFGKCEIAGVEFDGHDKACGSIRGKAFYLNDAMDVLNYIVVDKTHSLDRLDFSTKE